ncbi:hypothetical protein WJX82_009860 [Trebouxia sp. C0006]
MSTTSPPHGNEHVRLLQLQLLQQHLQAHAHDPDTVALLEDLLPLDLSSQLTTRIHLVLKQQVVFAVQKPLAMLEEGTPGVSLPYIPAGSSPAEAPQPSSQALLEQVQDSAGLSTQPTPAGAAAHAVMLELSAGHDRVHVTLTPVNAQPQSADSAILVGQSAAANTFGINPNAGSHPSSSALHGAVHENPRPVSSPEADQAAVAMDGQLCDAWQSDDGADVAAGMQTVRAQDVAASRAGALSQGPPLLDTQDPILTLQDDSNAVGPVLVGQSPDAPFSPDEMDIILGSDQMQPRDSIPPTENISGHPGTETSGDQRLTAATISLVAPASEAVEARSSNLPPTEDAHPETQAALHQLASQEAVLVPEGTSQPNQQTQAAPAHAQSSGLGSRSGHAVPAVMLTHLAAAAAASLPQLLGDQPQLPGDQPQLPGDQPQLPVQPPTEAQPSAGDGSQAQATDTTPSPAVAQGSQDPARLQCLAQQTVVDAGGSAAVDCSPAQTAAEASDPTSLAQSEEQLAAEHVADGLGADTLLIPLPAEGLQHTDWLHSDTEPVPEHVVPPAAVNLPAVKPAEEAVQALKHVAAPFKAQSQLLFQADAHDNVAEHESVPEEQASQLTIVVKQAKILDSSASDAKDGGVYSDAKALQASGGVPCQPQVAATTDAQQGISRTEDSVKAHTAGTSQQQQQQQQTHCSDQDAPECSPSDDCPTAIDPQPDALVTQQANEPAATGALTAKTTQQAPPFSQQASQPDAKLTLNVASAAVEHKAGLQPSQGVGSPPGRQDAVSPTATVRDLAHMPAKQSGSQSSLSRRTLGTAAAASELAADVTDADLADKENDASSLSLTGSDTQSKSQGLKEQQQGTAAAAAAAQVVAEAFTKQPHVARPRPVRRRPTLDQSPAKSPAALPVVISTPQHAKRSQAVQADVVAVWKTSGRKRMRSEGTDAPTVLTDTAEKTHPVAQPVPAIKALPNQPAKGPAQQQQRSDASRTAASPQTSDVGVHKGQIAVQSSESELRVKRSHTAGDADEPNKRHKGALWGLAQSVMGGMAQRLQSQHSHTAAKPPLPGASGHPQASRRASTPNQPSSGLAAPHGAEQARSYAETKSHRLAKRSSLQLLHMGSAPAPMQGHTGTPLASGEALSRGPGCMRGSSAGMESAAGGCKTAAMRDAVSAAVNGKSMASVPMIVPKSFRQHNARASLAVRAAIRAASPTPASESSSGPAADRQHTSSSTGNTRQILPGVQAVTVCGNCGTAAGESGQGMTGNGSVHEVLHGGPWILDGGVGAYPLGCRQQGGQHPTISTREEALQQPPHQQQQQQQQPEGSYHSSCSTHQLPPGYMSKCMQGVNNIPITAQS